MKEQSIQFLAGAISDYVTHLRRLGHKSAADVLRLEANNAISVLREDRQGLPPERVSGDCSPIDAGSLGTS